MSSIKTIRQMIASVHNPLVKHLVKLRENKNFRNSQKSVVVAGFKVIHEISLHLTPKKIFVENLADAIPCEQIYQVNKAVLKKITGMTSPEPIAAEFALPEPSILSTQGPFLALDAIRDPGNLGTLTRTALALGLEGIFFLPTCTDPFGDKALRASRGALFRLPWCEGTWESFIQTVEHRKLPIYVADIQGDALKNVSIHKNSVLLLSNEARGIASHVRALGQKITIPMKGEMESLNVAMAGGILMYTMYGK